MKLEFMQSYKHKVEVIDTIECVCKIFYYTHYVCVDTEGELVIGTIDNEGTLYYCIQANTSLI